MERVGIRELRQRTSELVRRVEAGEEIEITVSGRVAGRMDPPQPGRWLRWDDIADAFRGRPDPEWGRDRNLIDPTAVIR